jgi:hypothetical protein
VAVRVGFLRGPGDGVRFRRGVSAEPFTTLFYLRQFLWEECLLQQPGGVFRINWFLYDRRASVWKSHLGLMDLSRMMSERLPVVHANERYM